MAKNPVSTAVPRPRTHVCPVIALHQTYRHGRQRQNTLKQRWPCIMLLSSSPSVRHPPASRKIMTQRRRINPRGPCDPRQKAWGRDGHPSWKVQVPPSSPRSTDAAACISYGVAVRTTPAKPAAKHTRLQRTPPPLMHAVTGNNGRICLSSTAGLFARFGPINPATDTLPFIVKH